MAPTLGALGACRRAGAAVSRSLERIGPGRAGADPAGDDPGATGWHGGRFHVQPNQSVKAGQVLFEFDKAPLEARYDVASQSLATAQAEYRQSAQLALSDAKSKAQMALVQGKIDERKAEADFLHGQLERALVVAPHDGVALFDDPFEWIGKPVVTGERIMRIAAPDDVEIEAWLPVGDAIPLAAGA